jgi:hypothetical protein
MHAVSGPVDALYAFASYSVPEVSVRVPVTNPSATTFRVVPSSAMRRNVGRVLV